MTRVLIVDDKPDNLYLLRTILQGHGCEVEEARHGAEALIKARQAPPALVVSDLPMPVMDGYTLLRQWKADERLKAIPFVVYTATYTEPADERLALDLGADAFILKPAEPEPFMARLREVLAKTERHALEPHAPQAEEQVLLKEYSETGRRVALSVNAAPLHDAAGTLLGVVASVTDITERRRAEQERRRVLERVSDAFVALDKDWRYTFVNARAGEMFGRRPEDLIGKHIWTEFPEGVGQPFHRAYERAMQTQQPIVLEEFYAPYERWFENRIYPSPEGLTIYFTDITERKSAEAALRKSAEEIASSRRHLEVAQSRARLGSWELDPQTGQGYWSRGMFELVGREPASGRPSFPGFLDYVHPEDRGALEAANATAPGEVATVAFRTNPAGGPVRFLEGRVEVSKSTEGRLQIFGTTQDVTERRRTEETLRDQEARLRLAVAAGHVGLWDWDLRRNRVYYSPEWKRQIGYEDHEISDEFEEWRSRCHPDDLPRVLDTIARYVKEPWPDYEVEFRLRHKDGSYREILTRASLLYGPDGQPERMLGCHIDITERKRSETALRDSEDRYRRLVETFPDAVCIARDGRIAFANPAALTLVGARAPEEVVGRSLVDFAPPEDRADLGERLKLVMDSGSGRLERKILRLDGTTVDVETAATRFKDRQGSAMQVVFRDITERKRAEDALRKSELRFRTLSTHAPVGIFQTDAEGNCVYVNERWCELSGLTPAESSGTGWVQAVHPDDREGVFAAWRQAAEARGGFTYEYRYASAHGTRWVMVRAAPLFDTEGLLSSYIGTVLDMTERRRAEQELRDREERLRLFVQHAPAAIAMFDTEMRYLAVSDRWLADYRIGHAEELVGRSHYEVFPDIPERWRRIHERVLAGATERAEEDRFERADGSVDWVRWEMIPWHTAEGAVGGALLCTEVITRTVELREAERTAREAAEATRGLLRELLDGLGPSMFVGLLTPDGTLLEVNRPALEAAGLSPDEVLGKPVWETFWFSRSHLVQSRLHEAVARAARGEALRYDERIRGVGESELTIDLSIEPLFDETGRVRYLVPSAREITDRVRAEEELRRSQTMAALGAVVAGVAHEIRNPIFAMSSTLEAFEERFPGPATPHLTVLRRELERLTRLTNDLLDYGRPPQFELQRTSLGSVLADAVRNNQALARERGVTFREEAVDGLPLLRGDAGRLAQVFGNLIDNAVRHSAPGGVVTVTARLLNDAGRDWLEARVEDMGPGFAPEALPRAFEPFFSRRKGGTGLGLSIVQRLVELHGGTIAAGNRPEGGAVVTVRLPVAGPGEKERSGPR